jgi:hypothetical protein
MMDNAFFNKGLQGAVNGDPVKNFSCIFFNISMGKSTLAF